MPTISHERGNDIYTAGFFLRPNAGYLRSAERTFAVF